MVPVPVAEPPYRSLFLRIAFVSVENETGPHQSVLLVLLVTTAALCCGDRRYARKQKDVGEERTGTSEWAHLRESLLRRSRHVLPPGIYPIMTKNQFKRILGLIAD